MVLIGLLVVAWGVDSSLNSGKVSRNVTIAGVDVGGLERDTLDLELARIAAGYADTEVIIRTTDGEVMTTAGIVGLELDPAATADSVMDVGRGNAVTRPFSWLAGVLGDRSADAAVRLGVGDDATLDATVNAGQPDPVEPSLTVEGGEVVVVPGQPVEQFDTSTVRDDVVAAARAGESPIIVEAGSLTIAPTMSDAEAQVFADAFNEATADGIEVVAARNVERFDAATLRSWMTFSATTAGFDYALDQRLVTFALTERYGDPSLDQEDEQVITVIDGEPRLEGYVATACCTDDSNERILNALKSGRSSTALVLAQVETSEQDLLAEYGVVELIGEATTPHPCCQSRVTNIQLFADIMTGVVIEPGDSLSLNGYVGRRTTEKGFVESGVIYSGRLQTDVGGGISQFATTIFQAMFYAGLDIDEYQAHTLWFSRYADHEGRRGIESTISFPEPDVQFTNNTPYPVLIWPTYTDTSLTVSVYSTKWVEADVAEQAIFGSGQCTVIDTDRIRSYPDGTQQIDSFRALYQPSDGIGCDGKPTDPNAPTPTPEPGEDDDGGEDQGDDGADGDGDGDGDKGTDGGTDGDGTDGDSDGTDGGGTDGGGTDGGGTDGGGTDGGGTDDGGTDDGGTDDGGTDGGGTDGSSDGSSDDGSGL